MSDDDRKVEIQEEITKVKEERRERGDLSVEVKDVELPDATDVLGNDIEDDGKPLTRQERAEAASSTDLKPYAEETGKNKEIYDALISHLHNFPDDIDSVTEFGSKPDDELATTSEILQEQMGDFTTIMENAAKSLEDFKQTKDDKHSKELDEKFKLFSKEKAEELAKIGTSHAKGFFSKFLNKAGLQGSSEKLQYEITQGIEDTIPLVEIKMKYLKHDMESILASMDPMNDNLNELAKATLRAIQQINYFEKAGEELLERYTKVVDTEDTMEMGYIQEAQHLNDGRAADVEQAMNMLQRRLTDLAKSRLKNQDRLTKLKLNRSDLKNMEYTIKNIKANELPGFRQNLTEMKRNLATLTMATRLEEAQDVIQEIEQRNHEIALGTHEAVQNQAERALDSMDDVLERSRETLAAAEDSGQDKEERNAALEEYRGKFKDATQDLIDAEKDAESRGSLGSADDTEERKRRQEKFNEKSANNKSKGNADVLDDVLGKSEVAQPKKKAPGRSR